MEHQRLTDDNFLTKIIIFNLCVITKKYNVALSYNTHKNTSNYYVKLLCPIILSSLLTTFHATMQIN